METIKVIANNRKAYHEYFIHDTLECGLVLVGTEIKAIRNHHVQLKDAYCKIKKGELFVFGMHIGHYEQANQFNHDETRERKLLAKRREIIKLDKQVQQAGYTLIPLRLYLKNGKAKLEIGVAKGKKLYDKRQSEKDKTSKRMIEKAIKNYGR